MASKTSDVVNFNDTEYDLNDKEDIIELFNDLIYIINCLRCDRDELRRKIDYVSSHCVYRHNSEDH